jgi:hypothetical protein
MIAKATETCRRIVMYDKADFISVHLLVYHVSVNDTSTSFPLKISVRQIVLLPNVIIQEVLLGI